MKTANFKEFTHYNNHQHNNTGLQNGHNSSKRIKSRRQVFSQFVTAFLICCFLNTTIIAAPRLIVVSANEAYQDFRFNVLASGFFIDVPKFFADLFSKDSTSEEIPAIARIQIFPGSVTVEQGEQIVFSAVAYDAEKAPVSGVDFEWTVADTGRGLAPRPLRNGHFKAPAPGTFTVTVQGNGQQSQEVITVNRSFAGRNLIQPNPDKTGAIAISSRAPKNPKSAESISADETKDNKELDSKNNSDNSQNLLPGDGQWNDGNWNSSDDPGNLPGNPPGTPADDGAGNGNFQLSAPVISLPGRGIDLALNLNYNSRVWNKSGNELTYDIDRGFPAPGWSLGFGKIMDMGANGGGMLIDADGTRHGYTGLTFPGYGGQSIFRGYTTDGKFINYNTNRNNDGIYSADAYLPNGTYITYGAKGNGGVYPTTIRDAQGNYITVTYRNNQGPAIETITDTLGRVVTFNYDSLGRLISAEAPRMKGQGMIYGNFPTRTLFKLHYRALTLNYSFASNITPMVRNNTVWVIDSIYYPGTNTGYWFGGADTNGTDFASYYSSYGMLAKVEEQRGMSWMNSSEEQGVISAGQMSKRILYNYPLTTANETDRTAGTNLSDAPTYTILKESWDGRDVQEDAVTEYSVNNSDYCSNGSTSVASRTITVKQPTGAISKQCTYRNTNSWKDGLVFADETIVMNGTVPKTVSSSFADWQLGDYESPRPNWTEVFDENGHKVRTVYDYSNGLFNQVARSCEYDNSNTKLRCSSTTYENSQAYKGTWYSVQTQNGIAWYFGGGRHIFNLPLTSKIENPDGTIASRTDYEYDNYQSQPFVGAPGVIQHDETHDQYTTDTYEVQGECLRWENVPGEERYCVEWDYIDVLVYEPSTDKRGNVTKTTSYADAQNVNGAVYQTTQYDVTGNVRAASTACCEQTSVNFDISNQYAYPISRTRGASDPNSPLRITIYNSFDKDTGLIKQQTDANGRTSTTTYNPNTLRPIVSMSQTGAFSTFDYNDAAMTITEEVYDGSNGLAGKIIKHLNGIGLTRKEESLGANNVWNIVERKYTKYGEEWKQSRPYRAGDTVQWSEKVYDSQGRLAKVVEPNGSETKAFYNETTKPDSASALPGNTMRVVDAWGRERWGRYDQQERLAEVVEPNPDRTVNPTGSIFVAGSLVTKYTQDTLDNLVKTEQGSQIREFKYDSLGRMVKQKLAEQTATLNDAGSYVGAGNANAKWSEAFWYDNRSNLSIKTDARGVRTYYSYQINGADDPLNRLQSVAYDNSGPLDPNVTIHATSAVSYSYMGSGDKERISQIRTHGLLTEDFVYDIEGRVKDYTQTIDYRTDFPMTLSYTYDSLNRVDEVKYPSQYGMIGSPRKIVKHSYDVASHLSSLKVDGTEVAGNIAYNAADQMTSIKVGSVGTNQVTESYTFDQQTGLLTNQKVQNSSQTLLDLSYDYNRNNAVGSANGKTGHLTKIVNNLDNNKNREYEFDALGRLVKAKGGTSGNLWTQNYSYDRYGNRTNVTASGVAANNSAIPVDGLPNLTYNNSTNRITTAGFEYDSAGNQIRAKAEDGSWIKMQYDAANRLRVVLKDDNTVLQAFQYGSTNERLMDSDYTLGLTRMIFASGNTTLAEYTEYTHMQMTWTKSHIYLGDTPLSTITRTGSTSEQTEYNHPDRFGTRTVTNQAAGTSYEQAVLPFGTALNAESSGSQSKRFTSYERSSPTGLDYAVNRTYDSKQGRFTQVDPIGMNAASFGAPQTLNLYTYCANDPVNYTDPSGLFFGKLFKWIAKVLKIIIIAVAVIVAVAAIAAASWGFGAPVVLKLAILSGSLFASVLAPPKIGAIIGIAAGMVFSGPGIIVNFQGIATSAAEKVGLWQRLLSASSYIGAISNSLAQIGRKRQTSRQTARKNLSNFNPTGECLKALKALGINKQDLLNAFDKTKFMPDPGKAINTARTDFKYSTKPKKLTSAITTSRNGVSDFVSGSSIGFLVHEMSHAAALRNDSAIYNVLKGKVTGLPTLAGTTDADYSDALSDFFNNNCK